MAGDGFIILGIEVRTETIALPRPGAPVKPRGPGRPVGAKDCRPRKLPLDPQKQRRNAKQADYRRRKATGGQTRRYTFRRRSPAAPK
jgi:hypothetical protein